MQIAAVVLALSAALAILGFSYVRRRAQRARLAVESRWRDQALANNAAHFARRSARSE